MQVYEDVSMTFESALSLWGLWKPPYVYDLSFLSTYSPLKASISIDKNGMLNKVDATGQNRNMLDTLKGNRDFWKTDSSDSIKGLGEINQCDVESLVLVFL